MLGSVSSSAICLKEEKDEIVVPQQFQKLQIGSMIIHVPAPGPAKSKLNPNALPFYPANENNNAHHLQPPAQLQPSHTQPVHEDASLIYQTIPSLEYGYGYPQTASYTNYIPIPHGPLDDIYNVPFPNPNEQAATCSGYFHYQHCEDNINDARATAPSYSHVQGTAASYSPVIEFSQQQVQPSMNIHSFQFRNFLNQAGNGKETFPFSKPDGDDVGGFTTRSTHSRDGSHTGNESTVPKNISGADFSVQYESAVFFVIKSYSEVDVRQSIEHGVWTSTNGGNTILDRAYHDAHRNRCPMFLFFSVNGSGRFCGVAEMSGHVYFKQSMDIWQQRHKWKGWFPLKWHIIKDVPNSQFRNIILEFNMPVTFSRDTQQIPYPQGMKMLKIFKKYNPHKGENLNFGQQRSEQSMPVIIASDSCNKLSVSKDVASIAKADCMKEKTKPDEIKGGGGKLR